MSSTPLFLWDHVAAVAFWLALYGVEVALILSVYARYPEPDQAVSEEGHEQARGRIEGLGRPGDAGLRGSNAHAQPEAFEQGLGSRLTPLPLTAAAAAAAPHAACQQSRQLRTALTPARRMLPVRLGVFKRAIYALATGASSRTTATVAAPSTASAAANSRASTTTATAASAGTALAFVDTPVADAVADIEARSRAPLGLPPLPDAPQKKKQTQRAGGSSGLAERRRLQGLKGGAWDPTAEAAVLSGQDKRARELLQRKSYLRNFWYCAGECLWSRVDRRGAAPPPPPPPPCVLR
jgi:hypothetical protein